MKNKVYDFRNSVKVSQMEVAQAVGISRPYLSEIERGKYTPSEEVQQRLAGYFDCARADLFTSEKTKRRRCYAWFQS